MGGVGELLTLPPDDTKRGIRRSDPPGPSLSFGALGLSFRDAQYWDDSAPHSPMRRPNANCAGEPTRLCAIVPASRASKAAQTGANPTRTTEPKSIAVNESGRITNT